MYVKNIKGGVVYTPFEGTTWTERMALKANAGLADLAIFAASACFTVAIITWAVKELSLGWLIAIAVLWVVAWVGAGMSRYWVHKRGLMKSDHRFRFPEMQHYTPSFRIFELLEDTQFRSMPKEDAKLILDWLKEAWWDDKALLEQQNQREYVQLYWEVLRQRADSFVQLPLSRFPDDFDEALTFLLEGQRKKVRMYFAEEIQRRRQLSAEEELCATQLEEELVKLEQLVI